MNEGIVVGATIRCPWHHACFDLATGEATAAPAFDALLEYAVTLDDDRFSVKPAHVKTTRRTGRRGDSLGTMAIVGGGAAGFAAADAVRKLGWRGGVTIFSEEREQPYDRTLLTKDYLEGAFGDDRLPIAGHSLADLGVDFEGGESVQQIEPQNKRLRLANGDERPYAKLLLATGAAPRQLDVPGGDLPHVMVLRSLRDCRRILAKVISGARVAVVGGSFIAMEAAASLFSRGLSVDVIAPEEHPLEKIFGRELSDLVLEAHAQKGVRVHLGSRVAQIEDKQVVLQGGERIEADVVVVGIGVDLSGGESVLVYPIDRAAYARLCRLLSLGKKRAGKAKCDLAWADLVAYGEGLIAVLVPDEADEDCALRLRRLREAFGDRGYMALSLRRRPNDQLRLFELSNLATSMRVPTIVTNDVLFHEPRRRILQDVVTCIRHNVTIDELGDRRERHADRYLKSPEEMHRLFARYPEALARTVEIVDRCRFSLDELAYQYPEERADPSLTPQETLESLTWEGAAWRYPEGLPDDVVQTLRHELDLIEKLRYAPYFLTVHAIVRFARSKDILCQGRGSAANSAVCYVLGITSIDPARNDLLFERFVSEERHEPPDIDVDFEHERREIVMQWIFDQYGRDHAALCSTVIRYRTKGAIRDVGKALGLTEDLIKMLSSQVWGWSEEGVEDKHVEALNLNLSDRRLRLALDLARQLMGAPRHLSQHPGGFVLTHDRLDDLVPIEPAAMIDRQVIEWDKDDIDALKFMKVDVLALGMLTCMKKAFDFLSEHKGVNLDLATIPAEDPHLRDDPQSGHARHLSDREPSADVDAAAHQTPNLLRPRGRGGDRAARPDPGRHGPSLSAPARRA